MKDKAQTFKVFPDIWKLKRLEMPSSMSYIKINSSWKNCISNIKTFHQIPTVIYPGPLIWKWFPKLSPVKRKKNKQLQGEVIIARWGYIF